MTKGRGGKNVPPAARSASRLQAARASPSSSRTRSLSRNLPKPVVSQSSRSRSPPRPQTFLSPGPSPHTGATRQNGIRMVKAAGATAEKGGKALKSNKVSPKPLSVLEMDQAEKPQEGPTVFGTRKPTLVIFLHYFTSTGSSSCKLTCLQESQRNTRPNSMGP
ncbi:hypothetical protein RvY_12454 [Ramazzottius varieornatus]|uniref:Uncharacterized protein n=1 Tax=Ramazzottius varieornatus TaxID=947166 RepID=A0A1D1VNR2_RAMVA|nr:hypothetical protein RvY_12454 [Ramazzottius varieornatus]